jgi:hypothetical protein
MVMLAALTACSSLSEQSNSPMAGSTKTILGDTAPGIGDLDTQTKADKDDEAWWGKFYGGK